MTNLTELVEERHLTNLARLVQERRCEKVMEAGRCAEMCELVVRRHLTNLARLVQSRVVHLQVGNDKCTGDRLEHTQREGEEG